MAVETNREIEYKNELKNSILRISIKYTVFLKVSTEKYNANKNVSSFVDGINSPFP